MNWKKLGKTILFPHIAVMLMLLPLATVFLVYAMIFMGTKSIPAILSYVLSTYTLTVWCLQIPQLIRHIRSFKTGNKYAIRWREDAHLRVKASLYVSLLLNTAYATLQLGLAFYHSSFWFSTMAWYYISLAMMRFFLLRHISKHQPGEKMQKELRIYRACGIAFLVMNLALSVMIFFMVYRNKTFHHHEITTITMAAYTFTALIIAIVNTIKYRKYNSPVFSASKTISLASACVSMLTLESTMLTTFHDGTMDLLSQKIMLGITGAAVSIFIIAMAIFMIIQGSKKEELLKTAREENNG